MSTFVSNLVDSVADHWGEVDKLLATADAAEATDTQLHDAICRSVVVLVAANLEGFVRDTAKAIVEDVNRFGNFKDLPSAAKRTFCKGFIPEEGKEPNARVAKLIESFDELETKIPWESFLSTNKFDGKKNATPSVIQRVAANFGVKKVFHLLSESELDTVFQVGSSRQEILRTRLLEHLSTATADFPYQVQPSLFSLQSPSPPPPNQRTLWEAFVDDFLERRHRIAHGATTDNSDSVDELRAIRRKIAILQFGLLLVICHEIGSAADHGQ